MRTGTIDFRYGLIVRWGGPAEPSHVDLLRRIGVNGAILDETASPGFEAACTRAGIATMPKSAFRTFTVSSLPAGDPGPYAALSTGLWPGVTRGPSAGRDDETASASREPWVDSNGYWVAYLRALYPRAAPVLAYEPPAEGRALPFESLELALVEARVMGGNYVLAPPGDFRAALLKGDKKAVEAWRRLGATAQWLLANRALMGREAMPTITALVEPGRPTAEIANLLFRRNGSPRLAASVPTTDTPRVLVTTAMKKPAAEMVARCVPLLAKGAIIVTDDSTPEAWWRKAPGLRVTKDQTDRMFHAAGNGMVVAYKRKVTDPSEHAMDVIDLVTHAKRPVRTWNAGSVIATASAGVAHLVNYGGDLRGGDVQLRIQGVHANASLLTPGQPPRRLEAKKRGTTTEVFVPEFQRIATVVFG